MKKIMIKKSPIYVGVFISLFFIYAVSPLICTTQYLKTYDGTTSFIGNPNTSALRHDAGLIRLNLFAVKIFIANITKKKSNDAEHSFNIFFKKKRSLISSFNVGMFEGVSNGHGAIAGRSDRFTTRQGYHAEPAGNAEHICRSSHSGLSPPVV